MVIPEQMLLGRLLVIKRMIKAKDYGSCFSLVEKLRYDLQDFSNITLRAEIEEEVLAMESLIAIKDKNEAMKNLEKIADKLIAIFAKHKLE